MSLVGGRFARRYAGDMSSDPEDEALSWEGDDALEARRPTVRRPAPSDAGAPASDHTAVSAGEPVGDADDDPQGMGTAALVGLGILGGVYLLYTVGWVIGGAGMLSKAMFMLPAPLYLASLWLAVLAPALWFTAALLLTRDARIWVRFAALVVGALLLVPWPFVVAGGGGVL